MQPHNATDNMMLVSFAEHGAGQLEQRWAEDGRRLVLCGDIVLSILSVERKSIFLRSMKHDGLLFLV